MKNLDDARNAIRADWNESMKWFDGFCKHMHADFANNRAKWNATKRVYALQFLAQVCLVENIKILDRVECGKMRDRVYEIYGAIITY
jgi:hypothetical protein